MLLRSTLEQHQEAAGHWVSATVQGEICSTARKHQGGVALATHKVGEEVPPDDPNMFRHNLTGYVCCLCFRELLGQGACQLTMLPALTPKLPPAGMTAESEAHDL